MTDSTTTVGCALGGGGVRGLAHVLALETIDACGIRPTMMAGTSMGAIIAAFYAAGWSGERIHAFIDQHIIAQGDSLRTIYPKRKGLLKWMSAFGLSLRGHGLLKAERMLKYLLTSIEAETFEDLALPLRVVATDFHTGEARVFSEGPLLPAILASISIPGIFVPVTYEGHILVDGGVVNNLPYDLLAEDCAYTIAVDVIPEPEEASAESPNMVDAILGMLDVMVAEITAQKLERQPPSVYHCPRLSGIRTLDFFKAGEVLAQAEPNMVDFRQALEALPRTGTGTGAGAGDEGKDK